MIKTKHGSKGRRTPGHWHVFLGGNFVRVVAEGYEERMEKAHYLGGPLDIAEAQYAATEDYSKDREKAIANAKLMAKAPELLEALTQLRGWHKTEYESNSRLDVEVDRLIQDCEE